MDGILSEKFTGIRLFWGAGARFGFDNLLGML
jgi:hypothetical protein